MFLEERIKKAEKQVAEEEEENRGDNFFSPSKLGLSSPNPQFLRPVSPNSDKKITTPSGSVPCRRGETVVACQRLILVI